ncbi:ankyrin repeat domain-containing protein [Streptomyces sp. DSM 42041]|uniref:Ankyrin repeat domain-containing protein n=1 Tax=Streptomyces hazeniae TaxID=3075538 RepID=A0ABU2NP92_9ACTN|nr:ankyrin repeat domain-containing protein [Streptomyces sp. DSM 42041]MDT0378595.1 ankyrin repeat domain-containing protein [Streptomyces sp. DSM 42041]
MTNAPMPESDEPAHDPEVLELAQKIFDLARHGDTGTVSAYVGMGVPPNLTNDKGDSLVMLAAYHGHAATVRALLERGADPDRVNDKGQTPLAGAVFKGEDEVVEALLDGGADPHAGTPSAVETARMFEKDELLKRFGA